METVTLVSPDGNREVISLQDVESKLAAGYLTEDAWDETQKPLMEEAMAAWLANPETEGARFARLRQACEIRLSQTDYAMTTDYPISDESKIALLAYRQAIRELNHQSGAPWDGGGKLTPWPEMPVINKKEEA